MANDPSSRDSALWLCYLHEEVRYHTRIGHHFSSEVHHVANIRARFEKSQTFAECELATGLESVLSDIRGSNGVHYVECIHLKPKM